MYIFLITVYIMEYTQVYLQVISLFIIIYLISQSQPFLCSQLQSSAACWDAHGLEVHPLPGFHEISSLLGLQCKISRNSAYFLGLCPLPIENIGEVILIHVVGLSPHGKPCSYHEPIFNVSLDLIGLQKIELLKKNCAIFAKKICGFKKNIGLGLLKISLWKNFRLGEKFALLFTLCKMLPQAKCYQAKCYLGKLLPRQNVTRQNVTRQM